MVQRLPVDSAHAIAFFGAPRSGVSFVASALAAELLRRRIEVAFFEGAGLMQSSRKAGRRARLAGIRVRLLQGASGLQAIVAAEGPPPGRRIDEMQIAATQLLIDCSSGREAWMQCFAAARRTLVLLPTPASCARAFEAMRLHNRDRREAGAHPPISIFVNQAASLDIALRTFRYFAAPAEEDGWQADFLGFSFPVRYSRESEFWNAAFQDPRIHGCFALSADRLLERGAAALSHAQGI
ncbi:MAG: hypothetical protein K1X75_09690 [Leptospirales bacterium]|nr:hypothetical protein [Leptospirales bacterium]